MLKKSKKVEQVRERLKKADKVKQGLDICLLKYDCNKVFSTTYFKVEAIQNSEQTDFFEKKKKKQGYRRRNVTQG